MAASVHAACAASPGEPDRSSSPSQVVVLLPRWTYVSDCTYIRRFSRRTPGVYLESLTLGDWLHQHYDVPASPSVAPSAVMAHVLSEVLTCLGIRPTQHPTAGFVTVSIETSLLYDSRHCYSVHTVLSLRCPVPQTLDECLSWYGPVICGVDRNNSPRVAPSAAGRSPLASHVLAATETDGGRVTYVDYGTRTFSLGPRHVFTRRGYFSSTDEGGRIHLLPTPLDRTFTLRGQVVLFPEARRVDVRGAPQLLSATCIFCGGVCSERVWQYPVDLGTAPAASSKAGEGGVRRDPLFVTLYQVTRECCGRVVCGQYIVCFPTLSTALAREVRHGRTEVAWSIRSTLVNMGAFLRHRTRYYPAQARVVVATSCENVRRFRYHVLALLSLLDVCYVEPDVFSPQDWIRYNPYYHHAILPMDAVGRGPDTSNGMYHRLTRNIKDVVAILESVLLHGLLSHTLPRLSASSGGATT